MEIFIMIKKFWDRFLGYIIKLVQCDHVWDGCICQYCGESPGLDPSTPLEHDWDGCVCKKCGEINETAHVYAPDMCTCTKCGKPNPDESVHDINGCICRRCGATNHDWYWEEKRDLRGRGHWTMVCAHCGARGLRWSM